MAEKNATGTNENTDHQGRETPAQEKGTISRENMGTEVKNAHASGLGSLGRSEENNLPHKDRPSGEQDREY